MRTFVVFCLSLVLCFTLGSSFKAADYAGAPIANDFFCQNAAFQYCSAHPHPYYCMDVHYIQQNVCRQVSGFPPSHCGLISGRSQHLTQWCQRTACEFATSACQRDVGAGVSCTQGNVLSQYVSKHFSAYCTLEGGNTGIQRPTAPPAVSRPPVPVVTVGRPAVPVVTEAIRPPVITVVPTSSAVLPPKVGLGPGGSCYAPNNWNANAKCVSCPKVAGNQCSTFFYIPCHPTLDDCQRGVAAKGSGGSTGGSGTSSGASACSAGVQCAANTSGFRNKRPLFKGPSCYNNQFGSQFGPDWKPSEKTTFEKFFKTPTDFFKMTTTVSDYPRLPSSWKLQGCDAAVAIYENFVCALEILLTKQKVFDGPRAGVAGASITEFGNNGDRLTDLLEVASFFSHKFKETGRLGLWEEQTTTLYTSDSSEFPPSPGKSYHGRGPVQISYNYNYGAFSEWFYGDKQVLLQDPSKVDPEGPMGFIAALWFWFSPRQFSSQSPISGTLRTRDAIIHWTDNKLNAIYSDGVDYDAVAGLGLSTNVINGGVECRGDRTWSEWRIGYFLTVAERMGISVPDMTNPKACMADKFCRGLYSGCGSTGSGGKCSKISTDCGVSYVNGWSANLCVPA